MAILEAEQIENEIVKIVQRICAQQKIVEEITPESCPGKLLMSQVLVSITPEIEARVGVSIPVECYIFHDNNKNKEKLSIKKAVNKLLKVSKYEQQQ
jgi:hypothetical protein